MDLDALKTQWQQQPNLLEEKSQEDISTLLHKKTQTVIGKLSRSFVFEIYSSIIIGIAFTLIAIFSNVWAFRIYFYVFAAIFIPFTYIIYALNKKINQLYNTPLPVKKNLILINNIVTEYTKRCLQFTMALIPVCFIFSFYLGYKQAKIEDVPMLDEAVKWIPSLNTMYILTIIYIICLTVVVYYFSKWYMKKLYGNYLVELKMLIAELDENPSIQ